MIKFISKHRVFLLVACVPLLALGLIAVNTNDTFKSFLLGGSGVEVTVRDFSSGTKVEYEILSDGDFVQRGEEVIGDSGVLSFPLPYEASETDAKLLSYELHVTPPNEERASSAETLDLLLGLNKESGNISVSGSGLDGFSNIQINNGKGSKNLTADWAGLFSSGSVNESLVEGKGYNERIELAFQNAGLGRDFDYLGSGKVEVFFGEDDPRTRDQVRARWNQSLRRMTTELTAVMVMQTHIIGMFFDASIQLRTQRKQQELMARAHKDYHPSEQICRIGTFIRSVAHSESNSEVNKHALNKIMMNQYLATRHGSAAFGAQQSFFAKRHSYVKNNCDRRDNEGATEALCPFSGTAPTVAELDRLNSDIDYTRTLGSKLTIDVDFADGAATGTAANDLVDDEADIVALAKNLYFPNVFELPVVDKLKKDIRPHYNSRSFAAKMNVAHSSFLNIVGMKSKAPKGQATTTTATAPAPATFGTGVGREGGGGLQTPLRTNRTAPTVYTEDSGWAYMKAMLREFGIAPVDVNGDGDTTDAVDLTVEEQIDGILGERPSYYAQMEVLTKKIYQSPNFYTNLYDKPANVDRIGASIDAITLMHQRDRFESILRREMLTSLLIEEELVKHSEALSTTIYEEMQKTQF